MKKTFIDTNDCHWQHYQTVNRQTISELQKLFVENPKIADSIMDPHEAPGYFQFGDYHIAFLDYPLKMDDQAITRSMSVVMYEDNIISIADRPSFIDDLETTDLPRENLTPTGIFLFLIESTMKSFIPFLNEVRDRSQENDNDIRKDMTNRSLFSILELQRSLVYFTSSLTANETLIEMLRQNEYFHKNKNNLNHLKIIELEVHQLSAISSRYQEIIDTTSNVLSSIINNNVNDVMKILTVFTILQNTMMIISGIYGMNVSGLPFATFLVTSITTLIACLLTWLYVKKKI